MADVQEILKRYWGYDAFRPLQKEIITSVLDGHDTLAILPTGGGKSICFQVPAMAKQGICLVISPLIALMKDQVENLRKKDIPALVIHSGMKRQDVIRTLKNAADPYFKFLYLSPERLETNLFREYLPALDVNLIAVDESHCISQWGYDFRPSYLRIAVLRKELPGVPVLALTASATEVVQKDIVEKLEFTSDRLFRQSFERKNLSYSVFESDSKLARLVEIIQKLEGTAIVYCKSRKRTVEIASLLQMHGLSASSYHAGLDAEERSRRQKDWIDGKTRVMACTNAFGMGIDKPDVRLVVHVDTPDCLENYYQEAGRAGRDGKKSYAVLLYNDQDLEELRQSHLTRFPSVERIKEIYKALVNFLQIPAYAPPYQSYVFRFHDFIKNFNLQNQEAYYALKALEGDGWIEFNEKNFSPSTVVFTTSKNQLYEFQASHPELEPLLTTLLRTYSGIFDFPAFISEKLLAKLLRTDEAVIKNQLQRAASFAMIQYVPQTDDPQIVFLKQRVPVEEWSMNEAPYLKRKEIYIERVGAMIGYAKGTTCRSLYINQYFGDPSVKPCGICDNCLKTNAKDLSPEEFKKFSEIVYSHLGKQPLSAEALLGELKGLRKEKAWKLIEFLQSEQKIRLNEKGLLSLNH